MKISASILACNTLELAKNVRKLESSGIDYLHIDIMDGVYVENLTYGPQLIKELRAYTAIPLEIHLELFHPERYIDMFIEAGADRICFQYGSCSNPIRTLQHVRARGIKGGVGLNPADAPSMLKYLLPHADFVVLMSVEPGFGGQSFEETCYEKIAIVKEMTEQQNQRCSIMVDGGINRINAQQLIKNGADALIIGTGIFKEEDFVSEVNYYKSLTSEFSLDVLA